MVRARRPRLPRPPPPLLLRLVGTATGVRWVPAPARPAMVWSREGHGAMRIKANASRGAVGSGVSVGPSLPPLLHLWWGIATGAHWAPPPARPATVKCKVGHGAMRIKANARLAAVGSGATSKSYHHEQICRSWICHRKLAKVVFQLFTVRVEKDNRQEHQNVVSPRLLR